MIRSNLSTLMGARRIKMSELADAAGVSRGAINRLYHDKERRVDLDVLDRLCTYLNVGIEDILVREEDESPTRAAQQVKPVSTPQKAPRKNEETPS